MEDRQTAIISVLKPTISVENVQFTILPNRKPKPTVSFNINMRTNYLRFVIKTLHQFVKVFFDFSRAPPIVPARIGAVDRFLQRQFSVAQKTLQRSLAGKNHDKNYSPLYGDDLDRTQPNVVFMCRARLYRNKHSF